MPEKAVQAWARLTLNHDAREIALIADASNQEVDRLNARAQNLRVRRAELGDRSLALQSVHYPLYEHDHVIFTAQHRVCGQARVENGSRGEITHIDQQDHSLTVTLDGSGRTIRLNDEQAEGLRLAYVQHVYRQQGATVERSIVLTGGWQTSKQTAYVQATRARHGTAPTGTSAATSSEKTDKTQTESNGWRAP